jgi:hypothetical protein
VNYVKILGEVGEAIKGAKLSKRINKNHGEAFEKGRIVGLNACPE